MSRQAASSPHRDDGTASVELIAVVPFLLLAILVAGQIALAGHALWSAGIAARAAARASIVGEDAKAAARRALPPSLRDGAEVTEADGVSVRIRIPRLLPAMPPLTVGARTQLEAFDGG
ncbi:MAG TPA: hypothetical protein VFT10_04330 [Solirubrobacterales bacterium]|nr:hypothetical protein [Solirubrobacterales bacterium]